METCAPLFWSLTLRWSGTSPTSNMPLDDADDRLRAQQMEAKNPMANTAREPKLVQRAPEPVKQAAQP
jgi:hypothetical protein